MVKIKDFTLASKNLGGTCLPCHTNSRPWVRECIFVGTQVVLSTQYNIYFVLYEYLILQVQVLIVLY